MAKVTTTPEDKPAKPERKVAKPDDKPERPEGKAPKTDEKPKAAKPAKQPAPSGEGSRGGPRAYVVGVYQELRKVTWPTWHELVRMTQVVVATVILFAFLIGGLDLALSFIAKPLYAQPGTSTNPTAAPSINPSQLQGTLPPTTATPKPSATPSPKASATSSPAPSARPSASPAASTSPAASASAAPSTKPSASGSPAPTP